MIFLFFCTFALLLSPVATKSIVDERLVRVRRHGSGHHGQGMLSGQQWGQGMQPGQQWGQGMRLGQQWPGQGMGLGGMRPGMGPWR
ncbi:unnamed protein product [Cylicocyclus nassatus]|uniref:Uncharacterized protein n=1 Tax=Cylicocyclus nassatus TaxID=53992 RepID=A0AA36DV70_CYLNA|nr:unnamed protein product [Cylicocyclus nassatus]